MTYEASRMPEEPHDVSRPTPHHEVPYYLIFAVLIILTGVTVGIAFMTFPTELINVGLALTVAIIKASLVAMFFMHLKFEGKLIYLIVIVPLILCVLLTCALIPDILMTGADSHSASLHLFNAPPVPK
jgi:cytochrome c oxidase subunit 4